MKHFLFFLLSVYCIGLCAQNPYIKVYFTRPVNTAYASNQQAVYLNQSADDTIIAYINSAKYSIDVAVYNFILSGISNVATAINNAYARGVKIRWISNGSSSNSGLSQLNANIHKVSSPTTSAYGIMHNKFMIMDANSGVNTDPVVWTGSMNWDSEQVDSDYNNIVIIQDKNLALAYTTEFNQMWGDTGLVPNAANAKFGPYKSDITTHSFTIGGSTVESYFSPSDGVNNQILNAINSANSQLFFGVYTFTEAPNASAIVARKNAGVYTAGIIDQYSNSYSPYTILSAGLGNMFKDYAQPNSIYHSKYVLVDPCNLASDPLVETGSHNWTTSADTKNDENTLIIHDATIANLFYQSFSQDFAALGGTIQDCLTSDLSELNNPAQLIVYPNPLSSGTWQLETSDEWTGALVQIFDGAGNIVFASQIKSTKSEIQFNAAAGFYLMKITSANNNTINKKLIKL